MPRVSKNKVAGEVLQSIQDRLLDVLAGLTQRSDVTDLLNDLLTKTERVMFAKRLAIVIMLHKGYPYGVISQTLKVSESTISAMRDRMNRGGRGFEKVLRLLEREKRLEALFVKLDKIIQLFAMPPIAGKGRWRFLRPQ